MRRQLTATVLVATGSALGAVCRWGLSVLLHDGIAMPWATLPANVIGALTISAYAALSAPQGRFPASEAQRLFVMAGFCGGFTTFSLFSAEVLGLAGRAHWKEAAAVAIVSVIAWLAAAWLGHGVGQRLNRQTAASKA